jgi:hypothetical protein
MKKLVSVILVSVMTAGGAASLFANGDVLPARVGRLRVMPGYTFSDSGYDRDGEKHDTPEGAGAKKTFNLGFALEYGILDWLNAGVQWVPGIVPWSDIDYKVSDEDLAKFGAITGKTINQLDEMNSNGVGDLKMGAAMQILGSRGFIKSDKFRFTVTPGFKIPLESTNFDKELDKVMDNKSPITGVNVEKHIFAVGAQLNFDYIPTSWFSVNFMTEIMLQPGTAPLKKHGLEAFANAFLAFGQQVAIEWAAKAQVSGSAEYLEYQGVKDYATLEQYAFLKARNEIGNWEVQYSPMYTFALDPGLSFPIGTKGLSVSFGVPVTFMMGPGETIQAMVDRGSTMGDPLDWYSLFTTPGVTLSMFNLPLPLQLSVSYTLSLAGKGVAADSTISGSLVGYFQIPEKKQPVAE